MPPMAARDIHPKCAQNIQNECEINGHNKGDQQKNITEGMYNQEVNAFLTAVEQGTEFPNNLERDHQVLKLLYDAEKSSDLNTIETVL